MYFTKRLQSQRKSPVIAVLAGCLGILLSASAPAQVLREQVIELQKGWNAVHLEVRPQDAAPAVVFAGKPIDIVARYFRLISPVEFIQDPADEPWKRENWGVWYAPGREDAFLTSLHAIDGNQCYLVHATEDFQWSVTGEVRHARRNWRHDSYNLVGFSVDPQSPPTFGRLFEGAGGKIGGKIYRLQNGSWVKVLSPASTTVRSGEAFWTYCSGDTDYQGPLDVRVPGTGALDFGAVTHRLSVQWRATAATSSTVSVSVSPGDGSGGVLPLHRVERDLSTLSESFPSLGTSQLGGAGGAASGELTLMVRPEELTAAAPGALLKFSDGAGCVVWVPVTATAPAE